MNYAYDNGSKVVKVFVPSGQQLSKLKIPGINDPVNELVPLTENLDVNYLDAWEISGQDVTINLTNAKECRKQKLRDLREPLLSDLDKLYIEARTKSKDLTKIKNRLQYLRDITDDPAFDSATTIEDLEAITISEWTAPVMNDEPSVPNLTEKVDATSDTVIVKHKTVVQGGLVSKFNIINVSTAGDETYTATQLFNGFIKRDCNGGNRNDTTDTAVNIIGSISNCEVGSSYELIVHNISVNTLTLVPGTGVTIGQPIVLANSLVKYTVLVENIGSGTEAVTFY